VAEFYNVVAKVKRDDLAECDVGISSELNGRVLAIKFQGKGPRWTIHAISSMIEALEAARDTAREAANG
jgi:hypothetical protein